mgnify:CR=1 FL=1
MKYQHFRIEEREKIQEMLWQKQSVRAIAKKLDRSPSSISREIKRNLPKEHYQYTPRLAHEKATKKRKSRGRKDRLKDSRVRAYVTEKLKLRWSPEQISGRISLDIPGYSISHEAIYQYIYAQVHRNGYGNVKPGHEDLRHCLRRRRKRRIRKGLRNTHKLPRFNGVSIEQRPAVVKKKLRIGDWETDTVESCKGKAGVNTLLERKSGLYFVTKLTDSTSFATKQAIMSRLSYLPIYTLTLDNGSENACWRELEKELSIKTYFCHPYCSGERGGNENTNGLLRDYFPKKTDFSTIPKIDLSRAEYLINTRPRKRLNWRTPLEVFNASVALEG